MRRAIQCGKKEAFSPLPEQQPGEMNIWQMWKNDFIRNIWKILRTIWNNLIGHIYIFRVLVVTSFAALLGLLVEKPPHININIQFLNDVKICTKKPTVNCCCHVNVNLFSSWCCFILTDILPLTLQGLGAAWSERVAVIRRVVTGVKKIWNCCSIFSGGYRHGNNQLCSGITFPLKLVWLLFHSLTLA